MPRDTYDGDPSDELGFPSSLVVVVAVVRVATGLSVVVVRVLTELVTTVGVLMGLATVVGVSMELATTVGVSMELATTAGVSMELVAVAGASTESSVITLRVSTESFAVTSRAPTKLLVVRTPRASTKLSARSVGSGAVALWISLFS